MYQTVIGNIFHMMRKNKTGMLEHLVTSCPVFGLFRCLWSMLCS